MFDHTKPFRTRDNRRAALTDHPANTALANRIEVQVEGIQEPVIYCSKGWRFGTAHVEGDEPDDLVNLVEDTTFTRRSLRPGLRYRFRGDGRPVQIVDFGDRLSIRYPIEDGSEITDARHKSGRVNPTGDDHPEDVIEVTDVVRKWVRVYDTPPLTATGKRMFLGKEVAAERAMHWYIYDTEVEAKSQLRGVRAVFPVEYREGEGCA